MQINEICEGLLRKRKYLCYVSPYMRYTRVYVVCSLLLYVCGMDSESQKLP